MKKLTRREMLKLAGMTTAGAVLACLCSGSHAHRSASSSRPHPTRSSCGRTYRHGSRTSSRANRGCQCLW